MSSKKDFVISGDVLEECRGRGGDVAIPGDVTEIRHGAFQGCERLTGAVIPGGVTDIGEFAFFEREDLASVTIPEGAFSTGDSAFSLCSNLASVESRKA